MSRLLYIWPDTLLPEEILSRGLEGMSDTGGESFEQLFGRFSEMKGVFMFTCCYEYCQCLLQFLLAHAESLPHEERKKYAEKVSDTNSN